MTDADRLPTDIVLPVLVALWAEVPEGLDAEGHARSLWLRYERSTATRSQVDYNELETFLTDPTTSEPTLFDDAIPSPGNQT